MASTRGCGYVLVTCSREREREREEREREREAGETRFLYVLHFSAVLLNDCFLPLSYLQFGGYTAEIRTLVVFLVRCGYFCFKNPLGGGQCKWM